MKSSWIQEPDSGELTRYERPMEAIPERVESAIAAGVQTAPVVTPADASLLLGVDGAGDGLRDGVVRNPDGTLVVACLTDMPGVTAAMWDWWFSWHSHASERYRLWHPKAHLMAALAHDRSNEAVPRDRWVGNTSYVDEYIGDDLQRLAIRFVRPSAVGLDEHRVDELGLAVCARTSLRRERLGAGHLVHLLENTDAGCRMHSRFWLGHAESELPVIGPLIDKVVNRESLRRRLLPDEAGLALLRHCSEEMNHLARFLPELHAEFATA